MEDSNVLHRIETLVAEEHRLLERRASGGLDSDSHEQLKQIEVNLDQCWDLLRQRRALRSVGGDPNVAEARPASIVERYQQ